MKAARISIVVPLYNEQATLPELIRRCVAVYFDLFISTTTAPLRILSVSGAVFAALGAAFGGLLLGLRLLFGPHWASDGAFTIFAILFWFLGVQLIGMGLLGEYVGRISRDVQGRPRYLVREVVRSPLAKVEPFAVARRIPTVPRRSDG